MVRFFQLGEKGLDPRQIFAARFGQCHGACGADEKRRADLAFEGGDNARGGWLRQLELPPGAGEAAAPRDAGEKAQGEKSITHLENKYILVIAPRYPRSGE